VIALPRRGAARIPDRAVFRRDAGRRAAFAANERSAHAPQQLSKMDRRHGPGCGCCTPKNSRTVRRSRDGTKSFPASRPWMISH
jgi:hypothetical protein